MNTFIIAIFTCIISTIFVLSVSYTMSRMRFNMRKPFMNVAMILGLFPSFMSMIAVYYILKALGLAEGSMIRIALIIVFSAGSGVGFYVAKGFFDTIPKALDEAAIIDGATRWQVFTQITAPLSKPIIVYTILTSFMGPWVDFIFAKVICRADAQYYTVSIGLRNEWSCKGLTRAADKLWLCVGLLYESENLDTAVPFYVNIKTLREDAQLAEMNI